MSPEVQAQAADCTQPSVAEEIGALLPALRSPLRRLFHRYRVTPDEGEDILQDALVILLQEWPSVLYPARYLLGTVRNQIARHLQRRVSERLVQLSAEHLDEFISEPLCHVEMRRDVRRLLSRLPSPAQQVVVLRYGADLKHREIAEAVGQTEAGVRQLLCRSLRRLRRDLELPNAP
jgi:RNA polymerase sigma factor (sigma-70 family)